MDSVMRIAAVARLEPDPREELAAWREDLGLGRIDDPDETRRRLDAVEHGEQFIVRLDVVAEVRRGDGLARFDGEHVRGVWFEAGADEVNAAHAREMIAGQLERLHEKLVIDHGVSIDYWQVLAAPVTLEVDGRLAARMRAH